MTTLKLWVSSVEDPQLFMTEFEHPLLAEPLRCIRGKAEGAYDGSGTFQWTAAVKALAIFFLRARAEAATQGKPVLEGEQGSLAASLDYALGKLPAWLIEMFGRDKRGTSLAYRLINRSNPERKRPGPVGLALNTDCLALCDLRILCDEQEITDPASLLAMAGAIEKTLGGAADAGSRERPASMSAAAAPQIAASDPADLRSGLERVLKQEALSMLRETACFSSQRLDERLKELCRNERFRKLAGKGAGLLPQYLKAGSVNTRLGVAEDENALRRVLGETPALRVALSLSQIGSLAIFLYLKHIRGYAVEINLRFPHSARLVEMMLRPAERDFADLCALTLAPAAHLLGTGSGRFRPVLMMPPQSWRVLAAGGCAIDQLRPYEGRYLLSTEEYSSAHFRLDGLQARKLLEARRLKLEHLEVDEIFQALSSRDPRLRTIIGFPFYQLLIDSGQAAAIGELKDQQSFRETFLFASAALKDDNARLSCLEMAIRDAWLDLCEESSALQKVIEIILDTTEYPKLARRFSGLFMESAGRHGGLASP